jgi:hexosaminidase
MHLDVARHFFDVSFVKKYIDYLALHKMNYFHWHLTDDQGWRIEIKKYPELMSTAAYRNGTIIGRYPGTVNDNIRYGGFYTQDEVKEVVAYAALRHITVIPEIEMPGHASAAIAAFPWLSCFPEKETKIPSHPSEASKKMTGKKVQETWGVFEDIFCAGKDSTFFFLQDVMDEVLALFPSHYIHVGGDEAPKTHWKKCPACQARIKKEGLIDEHELQSYFIQRMEKYLNSKGRTIIGWDEILEGGLAPNAIVMSWRGIKGGIEAARQKHFVIMTPEKPLYFDHTQTKNEDSVVIGGYNPFEAVYAFEPVPKELSADDAKYILGAQANLWTEYIKNPAKVEYMIFPRMSALSEVLWSQKETKNWKDFESRLQTQFKRYDLWKANYSKAYFDIQAKILPADKDGMLKVELSTNSKEGTIGYVPTRFSSALLEYTAPVYINSSNPNLQAILYKKTYNSKTGMETVDPLTTYSQAFSFNKATGKKVSITAIPNVKYPGQGGAFSLVNGVYSNKGLSYPDWLGFIGDDIEATIDLGKTEKIDSVRMHTLNQNGSWVYLPQYVEVFTSNDGKNFISAGKSSNFVSDTLTMGWINVPVKKQPARYIKLLAKNYGLIPDGQPGGGTKAWLFADEIQVY